MNENDFIGNIDDFFSYYKKKSTFFQLILMFLTCGIYLIFWIYELNKRFEMSGFDKPNSSWGVVVMILLPFTWFINDIIFRLIVFQNINFFNQMLQIVGWLVIVYLMLQYLYTFCTFFGKITNSNGLVWYYSIYPGFLGLFLVFFDFYYALPLIFFTMVAIPSMQEQLNNCYDKYQTDRKNYIFFAYGKKYSN